MNELQDIIDRIKTNMLESDKSMLTVLFQNFDKRISKLEKSLKPSLFNVLMLIVQYIQAIALILLAYVIWKLR